ncbi:hypothetical protein Fmac_001192 [Flemingia macrophylla]|uniref:DUF674 family protein n=1 Tax=Flemingia macrophylla TaxID=520843 RepID=A0ABD1NHM3_9FABA
MAGTEGQVSQKLPWSLFTTMAATETDAHVSLKLVVNKEMNKVLFAEAGNDFVDILFSFLTLPLGTITRLLEKKSNIGPLKFGCLNSLYHSVEGLQMGPQTRKELLLQPRNTSEDYINTLKLKVDDTEPTKYFICPDNYGNYNHSNAIISENCRCDNRFTHSVTLKHSCNGFVKPDVNFVITDDLIVIPNTVDYITSFAIFQNLGINCNSSVKEMTLNVTKEKVLDLLKCSLSSKSCLTNVFLEKKPILQMSRFLYSSVENSGNIQIDLKLFIRKSDDKLLFAQGGKDFADMLLSFLTFPLGGIVRKFGGTCHLGSIDGLYKSVADLDEKIYFNSKHAKNRLVDPHLLPLFNLTNLILPMRDPVVFRYCSTPQRDIFYLQFSKANEILNTGVDCKQTLLVSPESPTEGFVKEREIYVAMDDLVLEPFSAISALNLLNRFNTPLDDLKENTITIGFKECLSILKASLTSTSALSNGLAHFFLTLPLGTITRLLEKDSNIGPLKFVCLNSLYHSVEDLKMGPQTREELLLKPRNSSEDYCNTLKLNVDDTDPTKYFSFVDKYGTGSFEVFFVFKVMSYKFAFRKETNPPDVKCLRILKASLTSTSALSDGLAHLLKEVKEEK